MAFIKELLIVWRDISEPHVTGCLSHRGGGAAVYLWAGLKLAMAQKSGNKCSMCGVCEVFQT